MDGSNTEQMRHNKNMMIMLSPPPHHIELHISCLHFSSQMSPIQAPLRQSLRSIALLMCDGQCLPWP